MNTFLSILLVLLVTTVVHELGHFLFCKLFRVPVKKIQIFYIDIVEVDFNTIKIALGMIPLGGATQINIEVFNTKHWSKKVLVFLGGIIFNLLTVWICYNFTDLKGFWNWLFLLSILKVVLNTIPHAKSDVRQIFNLVTNG